MERMWYNPASMELNKIEINIPDGWSVRSTDTLDKSKLTVVLSKDENKKPVAGKWYKNKGTGWIGKLVKASSVSCDLEAIGGAKFCCHPNNAEEVEPFEDRWILLEGTDAIQGGDYVHDRMNCWLPVTLGIGEMKQQGRNNSVIRRKVKVLKQEFLGGK